MPFYRIHMKDETVDYIRAKNPYDAQEKYREKLFGLPVDIAYVDNIEWTCAEDVRRELGMRLAYITSLARSGDEGHQEYSADQFRDVFERIEEHMEYIRTAKEFLYWLEICGEECR